MVSGSSAIAELPVMFACDYAMNHIRLKYKVRYDLLAVLGIGILFGVLWSVCPLFIDDLDYRSGWTKPFCDSPSFDIPWKSLREQIVFRFEKDNLRLANLSFLLVCWMPKWFLGMATGMMAAIDIYLATKIAGSGKSWLSVCLAASYAYVFLLGQHLMLSIDFAFNYIWGSAFFLCAWYLFSDRPGTRSLSLYVIAGFVTGCWHEGIAASIIGGFCMAGIHNLKSGRRFFSKRQSALALSVTLGMLLLICVPGMWHRLSVEKESLSDNPLGTLAFFKLIAGSFRPLLLPFLILIVFRPFGIKMTRQSAQGLLIVSGVFMTNMLVGVLTDFSAYPRQCFSNYAAGTVALLIAVRSLRARFRLVAKFVGILTIVFTVLMITSVSFGIIEISKTKSDYEYAVDCFDKNPGETIFLRITLPHEKSMLRYVPDLTWIYWDDWANWCLNSYTVPPDNGIRMKVVSEGLKDFSLSGSRKDKDADVLYFKNLTVIELPDEVNRQASAYVSLRLYDMRDVEIHGIVVPFFSEKEGRWFGQIIPSPPVNTLFSLPREYDGRILEWKI